MHAAKGNGVSGGGEGWELIAICTDLRLQDSNVLEGNRESRLIKKRSTKMDNTHEFNWWGCFSASHHLLYKYARHQFNFQSWSNWIWFSSSHPLTCVLEAKRKEEDHEWGVIPPRQFPRIHCQSQSFSDETQNSGGSNALQRVTLVRRGRNVRLRPRARGGQTERTEECARPMGAFAWLSRNRPTFISLPLQTVHFSLGLIFV